MSRFITDNAEAFLRKNHDLKISWSEFSAIIDRICSEVECPRHQVTITHPVFFAAINKAKRAQWAS